VGKNMACKLRNAAHLSFAESKMINRMEKDLFVRQLREMFFQEWTKSKINCLHGKYLSQK
jgi:hypothetical protein